MQLRVNLEFTEPAAWDPRKSGVWMLFYGIEFKCLEEFYRQLIPRNYISSMTLCSIIQLCWNIYHLFISDRLSFFCVIGWCIIIQYGNICTVECNFFWETQYKCRYTYEYSPIWTHTHILPLWASLKTELAWSWYLWSRSPRAPRYRRGRHLPLKE
jgi:hypothetical protein